MTTHEMLFHAARHIMSHIDRNCGYSGINTSIHLSFLSDGYSSSINYQFLACLNLFHIRCPIELHSSLQKQLVAVNRKSSPSSNNKYLLYLLKKTTFSKTLSSKCQTFNFYSSPAQSTFYSASDSFDVIHPSASQSIFSLPVTYWLNNQLASNLTTAKRQLLMIYFTYLHH